MSCKECNFETNSVRGLPIDNIAQYSCMACLSCSHFTGSSQNSTSYWSADSRMTHHCKRDHSINDHSTHIAVFIHSTGSLLIILLASYCSFYHRSYRLRAMLSMYWYCIDQCTVHSKGKYTYVYYYVWTLARPLGRYISV